MTFSRSVQIIMTRPQHAQQTTGGASISASLAQHCFPAPTWSQTWYIFSLLEETRSSPGLRIPYFIKMSLPKDSIPFRG